MVRISVIPGDNYFFGITAIVTFAYQLFFYAIGAFKNILSEIIFLRQTFNIHSLFLQLHILNLTLLLTLQVFLCSFQLVIYIF